MSKTIVDVILRQNTYTIQLSSIRYVIKLLDSIRNKKGRYRILKKTNPVIKKYIVNVSGMSDVLHDCGYKEEDSLFRLGQIDISIISRWISDLKLHLDYIQKNPSKCLHKKQTIQQIIRKKCSCGIFWGNPKHNNLCSYCYRQQQINNQTKAKKRIRKLCIFMRCYARLKQSSQNKKKEQKNKKRCFLCKKKVGYLGFKCNCGYIFCEKHRFPMQHNCDIDLKTKFKQKLEKENQKISKNKINKI